MSKLYRIEIENLYTFAKVDDSIEKARAYARRAFPGEKATVTRQFSGMICPNCESRPCCCIRTKSRCRCGKSLPNVKATETPFEFCSIECKQKAATK